MIRTYVPKGADVGLVFGKTRREDVKWVRDLIQENPNFKPFIYTADAEPEPGFLPPHSARGREVSAYLSYVVDYYEQLPAYSIFIHANEDQWHNDLFGPSTKAVLKSLRLEAVDAKGYVNLRCEFEPGCPTSIHPHNPTPHDIETKDTRAYVSQIYMDLFAVPLQQVPDHLGAICCAQFAVSRDRIRQRPKSDYQRMLNWVDGPSAEIVDSFGVGWVFESLWHVVFGMDSINCPETLQCRCDNYGWCGPLASGQTLTAVRKKTK
ncbi:hypothetical protein NUU61_009036 [Penicillium alfredii]|uniref:Uncharacterized protein n=1 Tax=Penicillium alfredii TaxID=1506179 RepID=A0A9W9EMC1_9EURO|nr:uncharacterized protein NUU61_009036 [Penicillium alfredii]KAJ5084457.1 hypothetical protein NUU61_009036 [Penicillium alfredii]